MELSEIQTKTLQFLIDNICADFTINSLLGLTLDSLAEGPLTVHGISRAIMKKDHSLDATCAEGLAEGVVQALSDIGRVEIRGSEVYRNEFHLRSSGKI